MPSISDTKSCTNICNVSEIENNSFTTEKKFTTLTKAASRKLSKIRQRIATREQNATCDDSENNETKPKDLPTITQDENKPDLFSQDHSVLQSVEINDNTLDDTKPKGFLKRNSSLDKVKRAVKRIASVRKERKRHSEAYHQDGKTNPFE